MSEVKNIFCVTLGAAGGLISWMLGAWSGDMTLLAVLMAVDFIMGLCVAGIFKSSEKSEKGAIDSRVAWRGLCKKVITWLIVLCAHRIDVALGISYIKTAAVVGFIANEAISVVENAGLMGIKLPKGVKEAFDVLIKRGGNNDDKKG